MEVRQDRWALLVWMQPAASEVVCGREPLERRLRHSAMGYAGTEEDVKQRRSQVMSAFRCNWSLSLAFGFPFSLDLFGLCH